MEEIAVGLYKPQSMAYDNSICNDVTDAKVIAVIPKTEPKYNVYAWRKDGPAVRVLTHGSVTTAYDYVDIYLARGWDAYLVEVTDDPGDPGEKV